LGIGSIDVEIALTTLFRAVRVAVVELVVSEKSLMKMAGLTVRLEQVKHQLTSISISMLNS
jgi:hypothetical protein